MVKPHDRLVARKLRALQLLHTGPINLVVYQGSFRQVILRETSSRGGLHA